ncbi:MAG TPA: hypothetical protein VK020_14340 [Microlunatus sp.]|nr:hypothetical protein [Microlunatus sp.]
MIATIKSELIKVRHSRVLRAVLAITLALSLGITVLVTIFGGADTLAEHQAVAGGAKFEVMFFGSSFGVWAYAFFAAGFAAAEFRDGMIDYTFAATADRRRVLLAKAVVVGVGGVLIGLVTSLANFALTQAVLTVTGHPALSLTEPGLLRVVIVFIPAQLMTWSLLALFLGAAIRTTTPTVLLLFLGTLLPILLAQFLPPVWGETVPRWTPGALIESLAGLATPGSPAYQPVLPAAAGVLAWLVIFGIVGVRTYRVRDV